MPDNPDAESYMLRFGPYAPPRGVEAGDEIQCEARGLVIVADWSDRGEIMWPRCKTTGRRALVLTGDLVRACKNETAAAVARHWGVERNLVMKWKRAIDAPARTPGTEAVASLKTRAQMSGKPATANTRAALVRAAKRPRSAEWRQQAAEWLSKIDRSFMKAVNRHKYVAGRTPHQCPLCGRFLSRLEGHRCLRGARLIDGELHVPGIATPFRLCQYCANFKAPDKFFGRQAMCRTCRSIKTMLGSDNK